MPTPSYYFNLFKKFQVIDHVPRQTVHGRPVSPTAGFDLNDPDVVFSNSPAKGPYLGATLNPADSPLWALLNARTSNLPTVTVGGNVWRAMPTTATPAWNDFQVNAPAPKLLDAFAEWIGAGKVNDTPRAALAARPPTITAGLDPGVVMFVSSFAADDGTRPGGVPANFRETSLVFLVDPATGGTVTPGELPGGGVFQLVAVVGNRGDAAGGRYMAPTAGVPIEAAASVLLESDGAQFTVQLPALSNLDVNSTEGIYQVYFLRAGAYDLVGFHLNVQTVFDGLVAAVAQSGIDLGGLTPEQWVHAQSARLSAVVLVRKADEPFPAPGETPLTDRRLGQKNLPRFDATLSASAPVGPPVNVVVPGGGVNGGAVEVEPVCVATPLPAAFKALKIHPSIGVARVSAVDEFFVYGETPTEYKAGDHIKRQAVQFRIFAYGDNNEGVEELTAERLAEFGVRVRWHARVANRKIARWRAGDEYIIRAEAYSDVGDGKLVGKLAHFLGGEHVSLGQITPEGLYIPPLAEIFRVAPDAPPPTGVGGGLHDPDVSDNSCDGHVTAELFDLTTGAQLTIPVFGSWLLVTPPDFAPDTDDDEATGQQTLEQWLADMLHLPNATPANPVNVTARELDRDILRRCTGDFAPGIEASMADFNPTELRERLYPPVVTKDPDEVRFMPPETNGGATPGELTSGLCSPWQLDFSICSCGFWPAQRPDTTFLNTNPPTEVKWLRKKADDFGATQGQLETTEEFIEHVYELGVLREQDGQLVETERDNDIP